MYGHSAPTVRQLAMKILAQTASSSACERNWSTFSLIHTKQRNRLAYSRIEKLVYCYYNMKLKLRDMEAEEEHREEIDPVTIFESILDDSDDDGNQLIGWVKDVHLDDEEGNPNPRIAEQAEREGINVRRVIDEEVHSSSGDSFDQLMRNPNKTPSGSAPSNASIPESHHSTSGNDGDNYDTLAELGVQRGSQQMESHYQDAGISPFTGEQYFSHATQDEDHGSRAAGQGATGRDYTRRDRTLADMSQEEENSISMSFGSMSVGSNSNNPYSLDMFGLSSSGNSWIASHPQASDSSNFALSQPGPYGTYYPGQPYMIQDPYGWHIQNYMQNFQGNTSFDNYYSDAISQSQNNPEGNSDDFQPSRNSTWF